MGRRLLDVLILLFSWCCPYSLRQSQHMCNAIFHFPCFQAELNDALLQDVNFQTGVLKDLTTGASSTGQTQGCTDSNGRGSVGIPWAQAPRAWISRAGAISPPHFDSSPSLLIQVLMVHRLLMHWCCDEVLMCYACKPL